MTTYKDKVTGLWRYDFQYQKLRHSEHGYKTLKEARDAENDKRNELKNPQPPEPVRIDIIFGALCEDFLDYSQGYNAHRVYLNKKATIGKILRLTAWGLRPAISITREEIEAYLLCLKNETTGAEDSKRTIKASTINDHRKIIHGLFQYGVDREKITYNPCSVVKKLPQPRRSDLYIPTDKEIKAVILAAPPHRKRAYMLQCALAARPGEVDRLMLQDVFFDRREVRLWTRKTKNGDEESRIIAMNNTAEAVLHAALDSRKDDNPWVFPNPETGEPYADRHYFLKDCKTAGVKPFHRHTLRHYSASMIIDAGASIKEIQELLGHSNLRTTEIYLHNLRRGREAKLDLMKALEVQMSTEDSSQSPTEVPQKNSIHSS